MLELVIWQNNLFQFIFLFHYLTWDKNLRFYSVSFWQVLMNLTNDNPIGCRQIASCGGLETLASLILSHFPSFGVSCSTHSQLKDTISSSSSLIEASQLKNKHLNDHELEFLVAILGLLVNLVEKDSQNR